MAPALAIAAPPVLSAEGITTLNQLFAQRVALSPLAAACRHWDTASQSWATHSWQQLGLRAQQHAQALSALALPAGARVAIQLENSPDWLALEQAIYQVGAVCVGVFAQDTASAAAYVLHDSGASLLFVRDAACWQTLSAQGPLPALQQVVLMQGRAPAADSRCLSLAQYLAAPALPAAPSADSAVPAGLAGLAGLAALIYTSGTGGQSRGAMMHHSALLANAFACTEALGLSSQDVRLSVLPLSHSFERVAGWYSSMVCGGETVFGRGSELLADDLLSIKPTAMVAVPRIYEHLYARLLRAIDDGPLHARALFHLALASPRSGASQRFSQRLSAGLVNKLRHSLGGRLRTAVSGGAALCPQIARTFAALGLPLLQGYGLTEAGPVVSVNRHHDLDPDSCGTVLAGVQVRVDVNGELLVKSPALMQGYWNDPAASKTAIDGAGWLHTGDKASRLCPEKIYLTGRLKDVLVTSTGVKACPALIEARLTADPLFSQALVLGEARPYLTALVVLCPQALAELRHSLASEDLSAALLSRAKGRLSELAASHQLCALAVVPAFTQANGQLTITAKPRRAAILKAHAARIAELYQGHCASHSSDCSANAEVR